MNDSHQNEISSILITKAQNWNHWFIQLVYKPLPSPVKSWNLHLQQKGELKTALIHTNIVHRKLQSWPKFFRQTVVFNVYFSRFFASIDKMLILGARLSTRLQLYAVLRSSWYFLMSYGPKSEIVPQLVRQLIYTMFVTNNHDSFYLWWHKNFVKHQNVSKYYGQDCSTTLKDW